LNNIDNPVILNPSKEITIKINNIQIEIEKVTTKRIYEHLVDIKFNTPTAQPKINGRLNKNLTVQDWEVIYKRIYTTSIDTYSRYFKYKILNNIHGGPFLSP